VKLGALDADTHKQMGSLYGVSSTRSLMKWSYLVFLLGIFRRAPHPSDTRGCPFTSQGAPCPFKKKIKKNLLVIYDASSIREPPKVS
jgi:hypothetical protein